MLTAWFNCLLFVTPIWFLKISLFYFPCSDIWIPVKLYYFIVAVFVSILLWQRFWCQTIVFMTEFEALSLPLQPLTVGRGGEAGARTTPTKPYSPGTRAWSQHGNMEGKLHRNIQGIEYVLRIAIFYVSSMIWINDLFIILRRPFLWK